MSNGLRWNLAEIIDALQIGGSMNKMSDQYAKILVYLTNMKIKTIYTCPCGYIGRHKPLTPCCSNPALDVHKEFVE